MDIDELEQLTAAVYAAADPSMAAMLRAAADSVSRGTGDAARHAAVRGGAYLVVSKLSLLRPDLERAIGWLTTAVEAGRTPSRLANLAAALLERCDLDGTVDDHRRAVALLRDALAETDASAPGRSTRMIILLGAYVDAVERGFGGVTLDDALDHGEAVLREFPGAQRGEPENLLGAALMLAAQRGHPRTDTRRMVELLDRAVACLPDGHPDLPARLSNLGGALLDRYEMTGSRTDLERAATTSRRAYALFPQHHPSRPLALNNFINAVVASYERFGDTEELAAALPHARTLAAAFTSGHPLHPVALANSGLLFRAAARALNRSALVDEAVSCHEAAVAATPSAAPALAGRLASLALALADRYRRDQDVTDLERAITYGTRSLDSDASHEVELSGFAANVGTFLHSRYLLGGRVSDLHGAAALHKRGISRLPAGHHDRAAVLNNAGIVLLDIYDRLGEETDLELAATYLAEAVAAGDDTDPESAGRLVNLAAVLLRQAATRHTVRRLDEAEAIARRALTIVRHDETRRTAIATLVNIMRERWQHTDDRGDLDRMAELDAAVEPGTPAAHLRRGISRGMVGDRTSEVRHLLAALESGVDARPAVAISAAQLLADHGVRLVAAGDAGGGDLVERAAAGATAARDRLVGTGEGRRADLSWHRDLTGLGALWAHARWLRGDIDGALAAFEATRAVLLTGHVPAAPPPDSTYLAIWCTPVGGAAVIARPTGPPVAAGLPELTPHLVERLAHRLSVAALLGRTSLDAVVAAVAGQISRTITTALEPVLRAGEPLVCAAGGGLALLPLGLGEMSGRPLVFRHPFTLALNRHSAAWSQAAGPLRPLDLGDAVSVADPLPTRLPRLPAALRESAFFASPERRRHGTAATPAALLAALREASVVHIATHAAAPASDPLAHHFVLAGDEPLFADAILDAGPLRTRLAVLSGCGTGRTTVTHADEGLALASAVHAAGVVGVMSSLWSVVDRPTARLMRRVKEELQEGRPPVEALREAQLSTIADGGRPADWAAFTMLGS
ncbi:MAG TPA: CHAT domain-containing protein [Pseudonocardiaceae bacterium]